MKPSTVRWVRISALSLLGLLLLLFTYALRDVFIPVLAAALIAYVLNPVVNALEKIRVRRLVGVSAIYALLLIAVLGVLFLMMPLLYSEISSLGAALAGESFTDADQNGRHDEGEPFEDENRDSVYNPGYVDRAWQWLAKQIERWNDRFAGQPGRQINVENLAATAREQSLSLKEFAAGGASVTRWLFRVLSSGVRRAVLLVSAVVLIPVYSFFLLLGMNHIWTAFKEHLPGRQRTRVLDVLGKIHNSTSAFFRGRLTVCLISGVLTAVGVYFFGVRFALVIGVIVGIGGLIPFVGVLAGLLPAMLLAFADKGLGSAVGVVIVFIIVQSAEAWVFTPLVIGKKVQLHPVTIILALLVAAETLGFFGILLAVPLVSTVKILAQEFVLPQLRVLAKETPPQPQPGVS